MVETFAGHFQAQLTLLYVLEPFAYNDIPVDATGASERRLAEYLSEELTQIDVRRVMLEGDPTTQITEYARDNDSDLIMLPTHGYGGFRGLLSLSKQFGGLIGTGLRPPGAGRKAESLCKLPDKGKDRESNLLGDLSHLNVL